jgi:hypothetical protein
LAVGLTYDEKGNGDKPDETGATSGIVRKFAILQQS